MWFKVDDGFNGHRKVMALKRGPERLRAVGLWTLAGSWSAEQGLGGFVPNYIIEQIGATQRDVDALVRVGLWTPVTDGTAFHDWDYYQPDAESQAAAKEKESLSGRVGNHRRWHVARSITVPSCEFCHPIPDRGPDNLPDRVLDRVLDRVSVGSVSPVPVPDTDREADASSRIVGREIARLEPPRGDVERICEHLADRIEGNGAKRPAITAKWRDSARLMLDADKRTEAEVLGAIDWCQADEFWRANVLSMPKLREKYEQLRLQAQRKSGSTSRNQETRDMLDRAMQRAEERERNAR